MDEETHYRILRLLEQNPALTQRELAHELGVSLGKTNYCLKALIEKGVVKAKNFYRNPNKRIYAYLLTAKGVDEKARLTLRFLKKKVKEYEELEREIEELRREVASESSD